MAPEAQPCRSCKAPVYWANHERTGKPAPLVVDPHGKLRVWPHEGGYVYGTAKDTDPEGRRYTSHFADCPKAKAWRARMRAGGGTRA